MDVCPSTIRPTCGVHIFGATRQTTSLGVSRKRRTRAAFPKLAKQRAAAAPTGTRDPDAPKGRRSTAPLGPEKNRIRRNAEIGTMWAWVKIQPLGDRWFRPYFHLPGFHFGRTCLTHSHVSQHTVDGRDPFRATKETLE